MLNVIKAANRPYKISMTYQIQLRPITDSLSTKYGLTIVFCTITLSFLIYSKFFNCQILLVRKDLCKRIRVELHCVCAVLKIVIFVNMPVVELLECGNYWMQQRS